MNTNNNEQLEFSIFNTGMAVQAMRENGYKSTTRALAELIDNSIEAGATSIELFGLSSQTNQTGPHFLKKLAVLDNGEGMDKHTLRGSLRFGHSTRIRRRGIGRFGVGLPNSSMSQAKCVDVWSWQTGASNAFHTLLSIDEVEDGAQEIPEPTLEKLPDWIQVATRNGFEDSGTLVVWSELDKVQWKKIATVFKHVERLLGRIYRRFLANSANRLHPKDNRGDEIGPQRSIVCIPVEEQGYRFHVTEEVTTVRPNDPLNLMSNTSCPEDFGPGPMFEELPTSPFPISVKFNGTTHEVRIRAAYARAHVRDPRNKLAEWPAELRKRDSGHTPWGKHADFNRGISVMRAHREIEVDKSWLSGDDPRERWWSIEVDFPTELDEVFGVTNNKQGAMTFKNLAHFNWQKEAFPGENTLSDVRRRMKEFGDHQAYMLDLKQQIENARGIMRTNIRQSFRERHPSTEEETLNAADEGSTKVFDRRKEEGHTGESDTLAESRSDKINVKIQLDSLTDTHNIPLDVATEIVENTLKINSRVQWIRSSQDSPAFFSVAPQGGVMQVALNTKHPAYTHLFELLQPDGSNVTKEELPQRLTRVTAAFRILFYAWARFEDEQTSSSKAVIQDARYQWGKYAREFFDQDDK